MKVLQFILISFLSWTQLSHFSFAGIYTGNSGSVILCHPTPNQKQIRPEVEFLDLYEYGVIWDRFANLGGPEILYQDKIEIMLKRLEARDPWRAKNLRKWVSTFDQEKRPLKDSKLTLLDDTAHLFIPQGCEVEQMVIQREPDFAGEPRYYYREDLWAKLDSNSKAALVMHEVLYREAILFGAKGSRIVRHFVGSLASDYFKNITDIDYFEILAKLPTQYIEYQGMMIWMDHGCKRGGGEQDDEELLTCSNTNNKFYFSKATGKLLKFHLDWSSYSRVQFNSLKKHPSFPPTEGTPGLSKAQTFIGKWGKALFSFTLGERSVLVQLQDNHLGPEAFPIKKMTFTQDGKDRLPFQTSFQFGDHRLTAEVSKKSSEYASDTSQFSLTWDLNERGEIKAFIPTGFDKIWVNGKEVPFLNDYPLSVDFEKETFRFVEKRSFRLEREKSTILQDVEVDQSLVHPDVETVVAIRKQMIDLSKHGESKTSSNRNKGDEAIVAPFPQFDAVRKIVTFYEVKTTPLRRYDMNLVSILQFESPLSDQITAQSQPSPQNAKLVRIKQQFLVRRVIPTPKKEIDNRDQGVSDDSKPYNLTYEIVPDSKLLEGDIGQDFIEVKSNSKIEYHITNFIESRQEEELKQLDYDLPETPMVRIYPHLEKVVISGDNSLQITFRKFLFSSSVEEDDSPNEKKTESRLVLAEIVRTSSKQKLNYRPREDGFRLSSQRTWDYPGWSIYLYPDCESSRDAYTDGACKLDRISIDWSQPKDSEPKITLTFATSMRLELNSWSKIKLTKVKNESKNCNSCDTWESKVDLSSDYSVDLNSGAQIQLQGGAMRSFSSTVSKSTSIGAWVRSPGVFSNAKFRKTKIPAGRKITSKMDWF